MRANRMADPKVSVVLLTHNGERFVAEAIESILTQTYRNLELIVVDDGSTDNTPAIIARFRDPRMRVLRQSNLWIGFAHNRGASMATGDYIASMSHDDISLPHRLATQIEAMQEQNLDICFAWAEVIDAEGRPKEHFLTDVFNQSGRNSEDILAKLQAGNFLLAPSSIRRRHCYYRFAWNVVLFGLQDYAFWLQVLRRHRAAVLEIPLVKYRVHDSNVSLTRFYNEYRQLEVQAARRLAEDPAFPRSCTTRATLARELLAVTRRLMEYPDGHFEAYIAANRAVNLDPTAPEAYESLAAVLTAMGHEEPAQIVRSIGQNVDKSLAYPLPILAPPPSLGEHDLLDDTSLVRWMAATAEPERNHLSALLAQTQRERDDLQTLLRQSQERRDHVQALLQQGQEERERLRAVLQDSQDDRDRLQSLLQQSREERDHLRTLLQESEEERTSLRTQALYSQEERDQLQAVLYRTEEERDALSAHLRAVANGKVMRLLNLLSSPFRIKA
ncbi:MAG: glycosyltransferase [Chloroflexi bacterium]|nr:glycosyltransferase [Chloroflexota bacterium]